MVSIPEHSASEHEARKIDKQTPLANQKGKTMSSSTKYQSNIHLRACVYCPSYEQMVCGPLENDARMWPPPPVPHHDIPRAVFKHTPRTHPTHEFIDVSLIHVCSPLSQVKRANFASSAATNQRIEWFSILIDFPCLRLLY
jgi:hypothetical protein